MKHEQIGRRRATNVSLPEGLVAKARELNVNVSQACTAGLAAAIKDEDIRRWQEENRSAIEGWNRWVATNGLPLAKYRRF